jgi:hypothetical protein
MRWRETIAALLWLVLGGVLTVLGIDAPTCAPTSLHAAVITLVFCWAVCMCAIEALRAAGILD